MDIWNAWLSQCVQNNAHKIITLEYFGTRILPGISAVSMVGLDEVTISTNDLDALHGMAKVASGGATGQQSKWSQ